MIGSPDISVVMGVYNGAYYLPETIDSILAQEGVVLELVVVDDGSTDQSRRILEEYANRDKRVRVFLQENVGLTRALVRGCSEASGRYIARQDVGDVSDPKRLMLQRSALDKTSDLAFVSCWTEFCGPKWEHLYIVKGTGAAKSPTNVLGSVDTPVLIDGPYHHGSVMFRTTSYVAAGGYRPEFYFAQDWDLWYRLAEQGSFQIIEETLYRVRITPGSISEDNKRAQEMLGDLAATALVQRRNGLSEQESLAAALRIRPVKGFRESAIRRNGRSFYFIGECLRRNGDRRALGYFKLSIQAEPLFLRAWIRIVQSLLGSNKLIQRTRDVEELS